MNLKSWLMKNSELSQETPSNLLIVGAQIVQEIREDVFNTLQFRCSAGVAHNKVSAY
jgi:nucleotidyltransferase/DNA polymerase involved in DNA repair